MNEESDKPASVLIGSPDDASELPPLQLASSSGSAKEPTQIPSAQILMRELDASNGMNPSYQERGSNRRVDPDPFGSCGRRAFLRERQRVSVRSTPERCPARSAAGSVQWRDRFPRRRHCPRATAWKPPHTQCKPPNKSR